MLDNLVQDLRYALRNLARSPGFVAITLMSLTFAIAVSTVVFSVLNAALFRPELPFAAGVTVLMGEIVALGGLPSAREALLGFTCAFLLSASALILNDVFDLEVDRVNAPERPIPSGAVTVWEAIGLSVPVTLGGRTVENLYRD